MMKWCRHLPARGFWGWKKNSGELMKKNSGCTIKQTVCLLFLLEKILGSLSNYSLQMLTVLFHLGGQYKHNTVVV